MANVNNLYVAVSATMGTPRTDEDITRTFTPLTNRNTPSFVFRLPTETLQAIFIHGAYDHYSKDNGFPIRTPPSWVNVSYVCRHWRYVALNCPILWTFLFSVSPRWMEELLSRSKQAPLKLKLHSYVRISDKTPSLLSFLEKVVDHAERIQEICLCLDRQRQGYQFFAKLFSHAPLLQNVKVLFLPPFPSDNWPPSISLDGDTPALRTLEVSNFPIPWYSLMLSGVTTLSLSYHPGRSLQNTEQFLATLSCMKDLKHLYLDDALPSAAGFLSSAAFRTFQSINLPHLSRLLIAAPLSTVFALLSCINIPLKTEIRLQLYRSELGSFPRDYTLLSPLFAQRFGTSEDQALSTPVIGSMLIRFEDHELGEPMLSVSLSECDRHPFFSSIKQSWGLNIPLYIITDRAETMADNEDRMLSICRSIPLTDVHSMEVLRPPFSSTFWGGDVGTASKSTLPPINGRLPARPCSRTLLQSPPYRYR
ncbi:hypothetical protein V8E55_011526 [Tylopilus felleus]